MPMFTGIFVMVTKLFCRELTIVAISVVLGKLYSEWISLL